MNKYRADSNRRTKQFCMKKLSKKEMKDVKGGTAPGGTTVCVSCIDTPGPDNQLLGNVMCTTQKKGQLCVEMYGTGHNGIMCMSLTGGDPVSVLCPVG
jgi:natural product precursor